MTARSVGSVIPKGDDKYLLRWFIGKVDGKRKYASETFEGTATQARKELAKKTVAVDAGTHVIPTQQTVSQYIDWWMENILRHEVTPVTVRSYAGRLKVVKQKLGDLKLSKLNWQIIQKFYNDLRAAGSSGRTVQYTHTVLQQALSHAVKGKLFNENPCANASPGSKDKIEMQVWTSQEVQLFLERTRDDRDYALWFTLLHTGLRPGEALGLKWTDIDGDRIKVVRAVAEIDNATHRIEDVKTPAGRRSLVLTKENLEVLSAHRKRQAEEILKAGPEYERSDFIFATDHGQYDLVLRVRKRWKRALNRVSDLLREEFDEAKASGMALSGAEARQIKPIRLYDTRHTHATLLLQAGVHAKVVSERLGHASITITLDTYSHVLPTMQDEAVQKLRVLMGNGG